MNGCINKEVRALDTCLQENYSLKMRKNISPAFMFAYLRKKSEEIRHPQTFQRTFPRNMQILSEGLRGKICGFSLGVTSQSPGSLNVAPRPRRRQRLRGKVVQHRSAEHAVERKQIAYILRCPVGLSSKNLKI